MYVYFIHIYICVKIYIYIYTGISCEIILMQANVSMRICAFVCVISMCTCVFVREMILYIPKYFPRPARAYMHACLCVFVCVIISHIQKDFQRPTHTYGVTSIRKAPVFSGLFCKISTQNSDLFPTET